MTAAIPAASLSKAQYQFSNHELLEIMELLLIARNPKQPHSLTSVACEKHIGTIQQILTDRTK